MINHGQSFVLKTHIDEFLKDFPFKVDFWFGRLEVYDEI